MMQLCLLYTKHESDAQEVLNNGFLKVFQNIQRYEPGKASLYTWIRTVVVRSCIDFIKQKTTAEIIHDKLDEVSDIQIEAEAISNLEAAQLLQGGFQYVSPRLINGFTYYQKTKTDYSHSNTTMTIYQLQKTWYTEVPVSFNVYVHPSWSVGAGAVYNRLRGAVANRETVINDALSGKQITATEPLAIKGFTDSFLYKTQTSLLLQTDYQTNRWSFGLRYMQDIQPFITYTLPDGKQKDKRNTSLALMIQYRLFRSSKFNLNKH